MCSLLEIISITRILALRSKPISPSLFSLLETDLFLCFTHKAVIHGLLSSYRP
jgi:hypothetical protein